MNNLITISHEFAGHQVRHFLSEGEPFFVASDVCEVLEIKNVSQAVATLDNHQRSMFNIGRQGEVNVVTEAGLYKLIMRSRKAATVGTTQHKFCNWVVDEDLPSIRKTGGYGSPVKIDAAISDIVKHELKDLVTNVVQSELATNQWGITKDYLPSRYVIERELKVEKHYRKRGLSSKITNSLLYYCSAHDFVPKRCYITDRWQFPKHAINGWLPEGRSLVKVFIDKIEGQQELPLDCNVTKLKPKQKKD